MLFDILCYIAQEEKENRMEIVKNGPDFGVKEAILSETTSFVERIVPFG